MELAGIAGANGEPRGKFLQDANVSLDGRHIFGGQDLLFVSLDPGIGPLSGERRYVCRYRAHTSSLRKEVMP
jgi:hypothetical protein